MIKLTLDKSLAKEYTSAAQKARVLTERWVDAFIYCPHCGNAGVEKYPNNQPVADFLCKNCEEEYELKSKQNTMGSKIVDGAYRTMIERLRSNNNPNFFLLNYEVKTLRITNFLVIPKHFFVPAIIEKRKPLAETARRAGWVGCNILFKNIPQTGKVFYVKDGVMQSKKQVLSGWQKTLFLRKEKEDSAKGWILDVMKCIEQLGRREFSLEDIYGFEKQLSMLHPENKHIRDKIRQQLQILRDNGYLKFASRGYYRLT